MAFTHRSALRAPSLLLLVSLIALMLGSALVEKSPLYGLILTCFFGLVLLSGVRAVTSERRHLMLSIGLALVWLPLEVWSLASRSLTVEAGANLAFIVFAIFVIVILLRRIVTAKVVDAEVILGSVSMYLLIAIAWAVSYGLIDALAPGSFSGASEGTAASFNQFLYFSLTTMTTLGYGDVTPLTPLARVWSTLEAVTGVFYLAVLVARLVSLYHR